MVSSVTVWAPLNSSRVAPFMTTTVSRVPLRRAALYTAGLAGVWLVAAAWRPDVTYHLAPVLVVGAPPVLVSLDDATSDGSAAAMRRIVLAGLGGLVVGFVATVLLSAAGWLNGPSLLPSGGAAAEAVVFVVAGAAIGTAVGAAIGIYRIRR